MTPEFLRLLRCSEQVNPPHTCGSVETLQPRIDSLVQIFFCFVTSPTTNSFICYRRSRRRFLPDCTDWTVSSDALSETSSSCLCCSGRYRWRFSTSGKHQRERLQCPYSPVGGELWAGAKDGGCVWFHLLHIEVLSMKVGRPTASKHNVSFLSGSAKTSGLVGAGSDRPGPGS